MLVKILESAHQDLVDGWNFYDSQEVGLGDYFADTLYAEIESLQLYAGIHVRKWGFYRMISKRFPYSIYYLIQDSEVRVYGVIDDRRNPRWIFGHLKLARG